MKFSRAVNKLSLVVLAIVVAALAGCVSVPMAPKEQDAAAKIFKNPSSDKAGLYVFRDSSFGAALKKKIVLDGKPLGETASNTYFYKEIASGNHTLATESEFGDNTLDFKAESGMNYYIRQYIKMGVFVGGANLEMVSEEEGKNGVLQCDMAQEQILTQAQVK